ncbi:MAG: L-rhamnose catabolism isomerase [Gammaproteobacteria bacterium]|nr:L-rhamnose catabolism isomerase [Gammaproteobacteria bacterium]
MRIDPDIIDSSNQKQLSAHEADFAASAEHLQRRDIDITAMTDRASRFGVAIPSWGVGTGGTRFARFPGSGEPRHVFDKLDDCGVIHQLTQATPTVSLHIPWDDEDPAQLREQAERLGLGFDAMNSNTFQDQADQAHSYKFGSLSHTDAKTREQAIEHNLRCIEIGKTLGSEALTVWIGDGSNFPGQTNMGQQFDRYLDSMRQVYAALPDQWRLFTEHKIYEPAFYSTVVQDWGSSYLIASELGPRASCLVDLGHHAPNVNIEMIVSRLARFGKLGGFHFNDSKYGDDDLDSGSIDPYRLFLVFNELVDIEGRQSDTFDPAYMLDQSHNVTDPIESLITSAIEVQRAYIQASLVDRTALAAFQDSNDALMATQTLKQAFRTNVDPILQQARIQAGGAIDPISAYRQSGYRQSVSKERPDTGSVGGGIV